MPFDFDFTEDAIANCIDNDNSASWYSILVTTLPTFSITSKLRFAAWIAQMGHESQDFKTLKENLNYRSAGLRITFGKYFTNDAVASAYEHQPEKIANRVYANRMGNGDEASGDGWKYRGRGLIQITGKNNYSACSMALYNDDRLLTNPDLLIQMDGAVRSACWFWNRGGLNAYADKSDLRTITIRINGATNGLEDRTDRYEHALSVLKDIGPPTSTPIVIAPVVILPTPIVDTLTPTTETATPNFSSTINWFRNWLGR